MEYNFNKFINSVQGFVYCRILAISIIDTLTTLITCCCYQANVPKPSNWSIHSNEENVENR